MGDVFDIHTRHMIMSRVKSKDTKPELRVRKLLHALGYRFRLHLRGLPGTPDIVLPRWKSVIFVHGCFWHVHEGCKRATTPQSNKDYWEAKLEGNKKRDAENIKKLQSMGYRSLIVWECEIKDVEQLAAKLTAFLPRKTACSST